MVSKSKKNQQTIQNKTQEDRRSFLKKTVYATPTIVALGALLRPTDAEAGFGKPPSGPTWG